jgi:hypothetical protein
VRANRLSPSAASLWSDLCTVHPFRNQLGPHQRQSLPYPPAVAGTCCFQTINLIMNKRPWFEQKVGGDGSTFLSTPDRPKQERGHGKVYPNNAPETLLLAHNLHLNNGLRLIQHINNFRHHLRLHILQNQRTPMLSLDHFRARHHRIIAFLGR